jgi:DNA-binding GntR family transcriptional regulator
MTTSFEHHVKIVDAIEKKDDERARRLMKEHLAEIGHQIESEAHQMVGNVDDGLDR